MIRCAFAAFAAWIAVVATATAQIHLTDDIRVHVTGNGHFSAAALVAAARDELDAFVESDASPTDLDDAADRIRRHYVAHGFPDARVDTKLDTVDGIVHAQLVVLEGPAVEVAGTDIVGATAWEPATLLDAIEAYSLRPGTPFVLRDGRREGHAIEVWYHQHGFRTASALVTAVRDAPTRARFTVTIDAGDRYTVDAIVVTGCERVDADVIRGALRAKPGSWTTPWLADEIRSRTLDTLANLGHVFAEVEVTVQHDRTVHRSTFTIAIVEGPRARVGAVRIKGNTLTRTGVIAGRLSLATGRPLTQDAIWRSEVRLYELGLFEGVQVERGTFHPDPDDPDNGALDLTVAVEETDPWRLEFYGGYGSYERLRGGVTLRHLNIFGTGRVAEAGVNASMRSRRIEGALIDRITFGHAVTARLAAGGERRELPSYNLDEFEASAEIQIEWTRRIDTQFGFDHRVSEATDTPTGDFDPNESIQISALRAAVTWDLRSDPIEPRWGALFGASYEFAHRALGGELDFHRAVGSAHYYLPLGGNWGAAVAARGGVLIPFGETTAIPIQERFFNGGESSVRSFKDFDLGPRIGTKATGGEAFVTLNAELRFPIYRALVGAAFVDAGNIQPDHNDFGLRDLQYGVGGGLRLRTPVGPIRVDVGHNPDPGRDDDHWVVHVTVGYPF